ncbi:uncharacterized protein LOC107784589 [Nicotiana tabacum]|uniref:Uncharacterized protein n=1 Tax=Nicotiana tabacum TaxID=4097 RepID=A0A1S3Z9U2_TOBAC|nr:PREDICTED: uncharacterized protein LOC107784589 [Nicotiana tabacum]XP_016461225.1 PREDICTED: uncharacterized protein LOC107784589 [Nicotiana tabacum]
METQVHCKSYLSAYNSMSYLSEDSNNGWPLHYGEKIYTNAQYCNGFMSRITIDEDPGYDKDVLKQKILEHEETFKNQVLELHRLYRTQRDMMYEIKRTELHKPWTSMEPSSSSSLLGSHLPPKDAWKCHITSFPVANSSYARPSISGTEILNSPLSSSKVNDVQSGRNQIQNSCSSNTCEVSEARPSKVRKKLFDLQLPADDYIETDEDDEQLRDNEGLFCPRSCANRNDTADQDSSTKFFPGVDAGIKSDKRDASASNSCLRTLVRLADLNEPAQLEEVTPSPADLNACAKSNPAFGSKGKERDWYSSTYETGNAKGSLAPLPHSIAQNKLPTPCHPAQVMLDKACLTPGVQSPHRIRDDLWRERTVHSLETFHRNHEKSNYTYGKSFVTSHTATPYPFSNSSEFTNSWSHTLSSWGKPSGIRLSSGHTNPSLNSFAMVSKSPQSPQSNDIFGDKRHINGSSTSNLGLATDLSIRNGFHHGSSSGPKDSPLFLSVDFDSRKHNKGDSLTSKCSPNNRCEKYLISSNNMDLTSHKGFDLNVLSKSSLDEELSRRDLELVEAKREPQDCIPVFPWLKAKPSFRNVSTDTMKGGNSADSGFIQAYTNSPICGSGPSKNLSNVSFSQNVVPTLEDCNMKARKKLGETRSKRKILGVPIPEIPCASKNESSLFVSTSATLHSSPEGENRRHERRNMVIDINIACDLSVVEPEKQASTESVVVETVMETKATIIRNSFDLNSCITEDEDSFFVESNNVNVSTVIEIDLEALPVLETEQDHLSGEDKQNDASLHLPAPKLEKTQDEVVRNAAEAIVSISSSSQFNFIDESSSDPSDDPLGSLGWFVDVVFSFDNEFTSKSKEIIAKDAVILAPTTTVKMDYFEAMTLQLEETKEEDYMPKPFVPEVQPVEDAGATSLTKRTRRGNGRWGRQRRDFQRDILPGLASLSRHEVTEDIQTFGELMKAMGHSWNSGSMRRNGSGKRGRRRMVIETAPPTVSAPITPPLSLEDKSLTGWGKTTRRPRRQRCPAGHSPAVTLT